MAELRRGSANQVRREKLQESLLVRASRCSQGATAEGYRNDPAEVTAIPGETPRDILARGFALVLQGLDAYQASIQAVGKADPEEVMTAADAAGEAGVTTTAVANWCARGFITGARQRIRRGHWRFTRGAWDAFRAKRRIRARRGTESTGSRESTVTVHRGRARVRSAAGRAPF